jgi:hypothetical protein
MSDQTKLNLAALFVLLVASVFIIAECILFRLARRVWNEKQTGGAQSVSAGRRVMICALMIVLSLSSFPAATLSLVESFVAPWQILWPSTALFLANGVGGLMATAWVVRRRSGRMAAMILAGIVALTLTALALSVVLVRLR